MFRSIVVEQTLEKCIRWNLAKRHFVQLAHQTCRFNQNTRHYRCSDLWVELSNTRFSTVLCNRNSFFVAFANKDDTCDRATALRYFCCLWLQPHVGFQSDDKRRIVRSQHNSVENLMKFVIRIACFGVNSNIDVEWSMSFERFTKCTDHVVDMQTKNNWTIQCEMYIKREFIVRPTQKQIVDNHHSSVSSKSATKPTLNQR